MPGAAFDAFGLRRDATNWDYDLTTAQITALKDDTDRGYTFQEQLDNVGLIHMNGRVYDPSIGRFISADPTVPDPLYSQSFNRYSYVYNSPLEYTDPSGFGCTKANGGNCVSLPGLPGLWDLLETCGDAQCGMGNSALTNPGNTDTASLAPIIVQGPLPPTNVAPPNTPIPPAPAPVPTGSGGGVGGGQIPLLGPPNSFGLNLNGNNGVLGAINSTDGWQTWDGVCFGCGMASTPSYDPQERYDPANGNRFLQNGQNTRDALKNMPQRPATGPMPNNRPMLGTMGAPAPFCGPCARPSQNPSATKFLKVGAGFGATFGSVAVGVPIVANGLALAGSEEGMAAVLAAMDAIGSGSMAGIGIGGPYGAIVGGLVGLAAYGIYELQQSQPAPQPINAPPNGTWGSGGGGP